MHWHRAARHTPLGLWQPTIELRVPHAKTTTTPAVASSHAPHPVLTHSPTHVRSFAMFDVSCRAVPLRRAVHDLVIDSHLSLIVYSCKEFPLA